MAAPSPTGRGPAAGLSLQLSQQFLIQVGVDRFEPPRLGHSRFAIADLEISEPEVVVSFRFVWLDASCFLVRGNRFIKPARKKICVAEFVISFGRGGPQLQCSLVGTSRFLVATLFDFAVADLNPRLRPTGISIRGSLEIVEGVVIVPEPQRINAAAIPHLSESLWLTASFGLCRELIERLQ